MTRGSADRLGLRGTVALAVGLVGVWGCASTSGGPVQNTEQATAARERRVAARRRARHRKRRIIMNNDGNDLNRAKPDELKTPETFLAKRTTPLLGSQVDAIFYCTGVFNFYTHRSKESELLTHKKTAARYVHELAKQGTDSLEIMTGFGHEHGIEVFWSMRMNDTHDSGRPELFCKWKQDHPEYLVGEKGRKFRYGCGRWSSVDYGVEAVRDKVYRILADVCTRYDVDGIEMDFFRHPVLFKPQMTGEPVTQAHCDLLTELIRRVRRMTEQVAAERGRPLLIAIRIPDSVGYCKAMGIDLVRWLDEDLVDIVTGCGYFKLEPWETLVALGKRHDVPVYACLVTRRIAPRTKQGDAEHMLKRFRGEALHAWRAGVSGIYTFNQFNPRAQIFRELGDPALLETLERIDGTAYVEKSSWSKPGKWLKDGQTFVRPPGKPKDHSKGARPAG